nr:MAG TPA: hypothetical protein [Caudoviricetes sp.]
MRLFRNYRFITRWYFSSFSVLLKVKVSLTGILLPVLLQLLHSISKCFSIHNLISLQVSFRLSCIP